MDYIEPIFIFKTLKSLRKLSNISTIKLADPESGSSSKKENRKMTYIGIKQHENAKSMRIKREEFNWLITKLFEKGKFNVVASLPCKLKIQLSPSVEKTKMSLPFLAEIIQNSKQISDKYILDIITLCGGIDSTDKKLISNSKFRIPQEQLA